MGHATKVKEKERGSKATATIARPTVIRLRIARKAKASSVSHQDWGKAKQKADSKETVTRADCMDTHPSSAQKEEEKESHEETDSIKLKIRLRTTTTNMQTDLLIHKTCA